MALFPHLVAQIDPQSAFVGGGDHFAGKLGLGLDLHRAAGFFLRWPAFVKSCARANLGMYRCHSAVTSGSV